MSFIDAFNAAFGCALGFVVALVAVPITLFMLAAVVMVGAVAVSEAAALVGSAIRWASRTGRPSDRRRGAA